MKAITQLKKSIDVYKSYKLDALDASLQLDDLKLRQAISEGNSNVAHIVQRIGVTYAQRAFAFIENYCLNSNSLTDLNLAFMYLEVGYESELSNYQKNLTDRYVIHDFKKYFSEVSALLYWAILTDNLNLAKKISQSVIFCLKQNVIENFPTDYDYFSLWAFAKWSKEILSIELRIHGEFKNLIDHWDESISEISPILNSICDLHCEELIDNDRRKFPAKLLSPPFTIIPLEIHVINKLRGMDGLNEINVDHPLMQTQSAKIKSFDIVEDELLEEFQLKMLF